MNPTYVMKDPVDAKNDEFVEVVKVKRKWLLPYISLRRSQRRPNPTAHDTMRLLSFQERLKRCVGHRDGRREGRNPTSGLRSLSARDSFMDPKTNPDEWPAR